MSILPSVLPSVQAFSWNCIIVFFLNFSIVLETHLKLCMTAGFSRKIFPLKLENRPKIGQKQGFLNLLKNFVIDFFWICSIMKIYIICSVPTQIPYLGKNFFQRCGPKCCEPIRLQDFLINHIFRTNRWNSLIFYMLIQIHMKQKLIRIFLEGHGQRWVLPAWSQDSEIDCISRIN